jgi:hypothetical protein
MDWAVVAATLYIILKIIEFRNANVTLQITLLHFCVIYLKIELL